MDIKEQLKEVKNLDKEIIANNEVIEKIQRLEAKAEKSTSTLSLEPRAEGGISDKTKAIDEKIMLEEVLTDRKLELKQKITEAKVMIDSLPKTEMRTIFTEYYLNGKTWQKIAFEMSYSSRRVLQIHGEGLMILNRQKEKDDE